MRFRSTLASMLDAQVDLILVDGPNLVNLVGTKLKNSRPDARGAIRSYLLGWFDVDRLAYRTVGRTDQCRLGIVIFHSRKSVGSEPFRLGQDAVDGFWGRQGEAPGTSTMLVEIPGTQTEHLDCPDCGHKMTSSSEKGVDTSITCYMFETAERWDSMCLFSQDIDYVPAVLALRRRGKQVFVAHDALRGGGLVRVAQSFFPLDWTFLQRDFDVFQALVPGGPLDATIDSTKGQCKNAIVTRFSDGDPGSVCHVTFAETTFTAAEIVERFTKFGGDPAIARAEQNDDPDKRNVVLKIGGADSIAVRGAVRNVATVAAATWFKRSRLATDGVEPYWG